MNDEELIQFVPMELPEPINLREWIRIKAIASDIGIAHQIHPLFSYGKVVTIMCHSVEVAVQLKLSI